MGRVLTEDCDMKGLSRSLECSKCIWKKVFKIFLATTWALRCEHGASKIKRRLQNCELLEQKAISEIVPSREANGLWSQGLTLIYCKWLHGWFWGSLVLRGGKSQGLVKDEFQGHYGKKWRPNATHPAALILSNHCISHSRDVWPRVTKLDPSTIGTRTKTARFFFLCFFSPH